MILWYYSYDKYKDKIDVSQVELNEMKTQYKNNCGTVVKKSDIGKLDSYLQMYLLERDDCNYVEKVCERLLQNVERYEELKQVILDRYNTLYNKYFGGKELVR